LAYLPGALLVGAEGAMNLMYAETLGINEATTWVWRVVAVSATIFTAFGVGWVHINWKARAYGRTLASLFIVGLSVYYSGLAEYGFSKQTHVTAANGVSDAARKRADAEAAVARAAADLLPYADAGDTGVADSRVSTLEGKLEAIDATPGITWKGKPCGRVNTRWLEELCPRRVAAFADLETARTAAAKARAKTRLQLELKASQARLDNLPLATAGDARGDLASDQVLVWLPVIFLTGGSALGFFLVPTRPAEAPPAPTSAVSSPAPRQRRRKGTAGHEHAALAQRIADLTSAQLPAGIFRDADQWYEATQRQLAELLGYGRNVARLNRELHDAKAHGTVDLDTAGARTRIRLKQPG
jgi:hypothetical protein